MEILIGLVGGIAIEWLIVSVRKAHLDSFGAIQCRRCGYTGRVEITKRKGQGIVYICPKCRGDDWMKLE